MGSYYNRDGEPIVFANTDFYRIHDIAVRKRDKDRQKRFGLTKMIVEESKKICLECTREVCVGGIGPYGECPKYKEEYKILKERLKAQYGSENQNKKAEK